ncbi:MAG: DUF2961 domain-containing protein [Akkermansiaceae bacterium]|nr:DUF2961 domain-containing protein [Akkermansiaceae bacterium]
MRVEFQTVGGPASWLLWVDARHPGVRAVLESGVAMNARAELSLWRNQEEALTRLKVADVWNKISNAPPTVVPDQTHGGVLMAAVQAMVLQAEGDEKIHIDDAYEVAKFPSYFGTGTEDYHGWAGGVNPTREESHKFLKVGHDRYSPESFHLRAVDACGERL